jgi:hypothetical protein
LAALGGQYYGFVKQVMDALALRPLSAAEISRETELYPYLVEECLAFLVSKNGIRKGAAGRWHRVR